MSTRAQALTSKAAAIARNATLAVPSGAGDGIEFPTSWDLDRGGPNVAYLCLNAAGACSLPDGVLYLYGPFGESGASIWVRIGALNNGDSITLTATVGFMQAIQLVGGATRLCVAGTPSASTIGYRVIPIGGV